METVEMILNWLRDCQKRNYLKLCKMCRIMYPVIVILNLHTLVTTEIGFNFSTFHASWTIAFFTYLCIENEKDYRKKKKEITEDIISKCLSD